MRNNGTSHLAGDLAQQREDLELRLNPEATPSELAWARNWHGRPEPVRAIREPAAVPFPPDLSPVAIQRDGYTPADLDRLGLDEAGRVVDQERAARAIADIYGEADVNGPQARLFGWLGLPGPAAEMELEAAV